MQSCMCGFDAAVGTRVKVDGFCGDSYMDKQISLKDENDLSYCHHCIGHGLASSLD